MSWTSVMMCQLCEQSFPARDVRMFPVLCPSCKHKSGEMKRYQNFQSVTLTRDQKRKVVSGKWR